MSTISLRLPDSLHEKAKELAKEDHVSLNQLITSALAEKLSALATQDYLMKRAQKGQRKKFLNALSKVADAESEERDRW